MLSRATGNGQFVAVELCIGGEIRKGFDGGILRMRLKDGFFALDRGGGIVHQRSPLSFAQLRMPFFHT